MSRRWRHDLSTPITGPVLMLRRARIAAAAAVAVLAAALAVSVATTEQPGASVGLPVCEHEDSSWCVWPARVVGNGEGSSFVALWPGVTIVVDRDAAEGAAR